MEQNDAQVQVRPVPLQATDWYCAGTELHQAGTCSPVLLLTSSAAGARAKAARSHPLHSGFHCVEAAGVDAHHGWHPPPTLQASGWDSAAT